MTCARDIMTEEALEREFRSIRQLFKDLSEEEKPLRIEWGTREAMERHEFACIWTDLPANVKFHDDQISNGEVVVKSFPYMNIFADFRLFNGTTLREFDDFLARLIPIFIERREKIASENR